MAFKDYNDSERAEAIFALAVNRYDYAKTAQETGVSIKTLRRWDKDAPKKDIGDLLDRAVSRLLSMVPTDLKGNEWGITLGILLDKWLLMQGEPTSRTEGVFRHLGELPNAERDAVITEAKRILAEATGRGADPGANGTTTSARVSLALAAFAPRPVGDCDAPGANEGAEHGQKVGEERAG